MELDAGFPGGNVLLEKIEGDDVYLRQDPRDTEGWWFYWCFRVRGAAGRRLTFHFTDGDVLGVRGPAVSLDEGRNWRWLGRAAVSGTSFSYDFPAGCGDVRFSFAMPYLETHWRDFLARHQGHPHLAPGTLCQTQKGRAAELLRFGCIAGRPRFRALFTCRHHACEMMADYALEGIVETFLSGGALGGWLRENVEALAIPFMDKDGVEDGDQGKNRRPHDHNRDYGAGSLYPTVRALKALVPQWSEGLLCVALDLHCPWIRGQHNEDIYFVGGPHLGPQAQADCFSRHLERVQTGPLVYSTLHNLPYGQAWNVKKGAYLCCDDWAETLPGMRCPAALELPYANTSGGEVNAASARAFGRDLAVALAEYLNSA